MKFRIDRRKFAALTAAALAAPGALFAQTAKRVYRIATLDDSVEGARAELWQLFRNRLRELVLKDGNDVAYEARYARGDTKALPALAAELVALKPDLIVCAGTPPTSAAMKATATIPIVFASSGAPVGAGLVASLARPGGNVTGISILTPDLAGKHLELMRELAPAAQRLAFLADPSNKAVPFAFREYEQQARRLNLSVRMFDGRKKGELEKSFVEIKRERIQVMIVAAAGTLLEHRSAIVEFAAREKIPTVYARAEYVAAGGLLSYNADLQFGYRRAADYAQRILHGTRPADLPVEQSNNTRMALNLKTARALGIKIPPSVRLRADEVIE